MVAGVCHKGAIHRPTGRIEVIRGHMGAIRGITEKKMETSIISELWAEAKSALQHANLLSLF